MQIKTTIRYHLTSIRMATVKEKITSVGEDVEKLELLYSIDGNVKWYSHYVKFFGGSLQLKTYLLYDSVVTWLCIYFPKIKKKGDYQRYLCIHFIAAFFTIGKRWTQPRCSLVDE